jgi:hypothetical protein
MKVLLNFFGKTVVVWFQKQLGRYMERGAIGFLNLKNFLSMEEVFFDAYFVDNFSIP